MKGLVKYGIVESVGCLVCFYGHKYKVTKELILNRLKNDSRN